MYNLPKPSTQSHGGKLFFYADQTHMAGHDPRSKWCVSDHGQGTRYA